MTSERKMIISYAKWCTDEDDTRMEHEHVSVYKLSKAFLSEVERNEKLEAGHRKMKSALNIYAEDYCNLARTTLEGLRVK